MKTSRSKRNPLHDSTVGLLFRIHLLRGDCCEIARGILEQDPTDYRAVDDCARVEEALAKSYRLLQSTLRKIQHARTRRGRKAR